MNKRIRKKNDYNRIYDRLLEATISLAEELANTYAHLEGYAEVNDIFWRNYDEEFNKWIKLPRGKRCWAYILKKNNIPKNYMGYKNKTIKT